MSHKNLRPGHAETYWSEHDELDFIEHLGTWSVKRPSVERTITLLENYIAHGTRRVWLSHLRPEVCLGQARKRLLDLKRVAVLPLGRAS